LIGAAAAGLLWCEFFAVLQNYNPYFEANPHCQSANPFSPSKKPSPYHFRARATAALAGFHLDPCQSLPPLIDS
jgi:hypothetical protein